MDSPAGSGEVVFWLVLGAGVGLGLGCGGEIDDDDEGEDLGVSGAGSRCRGAVVADWSLRRWDSGARWSG